MYMKLDVSPLKFNAVFRSEEEGGFSVSVLELPGCFSEGETLEEATSNIKEAIKLYLEAISEDELVYLPESESIIVSQVELEVTRGV